MEEDTQVLEEEKPEPEKNLLSLTQFCSAVSKRVPVETLSLFYELEFDEEHFMGTFEEYQQRLEELKQRPL